MLDSIEIFALKKERRISYFHNFARFDAIFIMKYYTDQGDKCRIKTLMRNHALYELRVYAGTHLVLRYRDSMTLLTSSLDSFNNPKTLCPLLCSFSRETKR